jgi:cysteinyl-tRNA synthetase
MTVLRLYNTLGREIQDFKPLRAGEVGLYTCGPTVYNFAHIGNLRTYLFEDILRRTLEYNDLQVSHVMNITDVGHLTDDADQGEDKILKSAREKGKTVWEIAAYYTKVFFHDLKRLNILPPTRTCRATEHIEEMIALIRRIEANGYTYAAGGNLYFDISRLKDYGKLALLNLDDLKAGARIEIDANKRNPHDFVLWFTRSKFEHQAMLWDSPWGRGYPGWHLECSAMSMKYLGERFDIHCGGVDHISVHHTNEIAQSEAATGAKWVTYWLHGEFLVMAKEKMAKSSGNFLTLASLEESGYSPLDYRYFCLNAHYRSQLQFSFEGLESARRARGNLVERVRRIKAAASAGGTAASEAHPEDSPSAPQSARRAYLDSFRQNLANDLNTPQGLADLWGLLKDEAIEEHAKLPAVLEMDRILGLDLAGIEAKEQELSEEIRELITAREQARRDKDYTRADEIREQLKNKGISLEDTAGGVRWRIQQ